MNSYHVTTPTSQDLDYFRVSTHKSVILFDVKACSHMMVALSNGTHVSHVVHFDYNGKLVIEPITGGGNHVRLFANFDCCSNLFVKML